MKVCKGIASTAWPLGLQPASTQPTMRCQSGVKCGSLWGKMAELSAGFGGSCLNDGSTALISEAAHAGTWVLLAIGLNVVVGFAGLLDLGYAAFFAIGAYTYALFASAQLGASPIHHSFHIPFWLMLFVGMFVAALCGALLGFPYLGLAFVTNAIRGIGWGGFSTAVAVGVALIAPAVRACAASCRYCWPAASRACISASHCGANRTSARGGRAVRRRTP